MSAAKISHVRIGHVVRGPLHLAQLLELAEGGAITPTTDAAASATGPWSPINTWPEGAQLFPARPTLLFKATEFEHVNRGSSPPVDHRDLIAWANLPPPVGAAKAPGPVILAAPKPEPVNEVLEIVREVARVDLQHAKPLVFPSRRKMSRRFMHCLIMAAIGNGLLVVFTLGYDGMSDEWSRLIIFGWTGLFNAGLAVIMLSMVPRY